MPMVMRARLRALKILLGAGTALAASAQTAMAADRSGVRPEVLSVPSGPGSIEGLGEGFEPSLQAGSARFAVAIRVPPGVAGHAPALRLTYSTGAGNGELGPGWSLALPSLQRGTDRRLPAYDDSDVFVLRGAGGAGAEDLVRMADGSYRFRIEGAFVRGFHRRDGTWEVQSPSGKTWIFGEGEARIEDGPRSFAWLLTGEIDLHGNQIAYEHERDPTGRPYLTRVVYRDSSPATRSEVLFDYEERPDPLTSYLATFKVQTARRLARIEVQHGGQPVFTYALRYEMKQGLSRLVEIRLRAADGTTLPPLTMAYAEPQMNAAGLVTIASAPARTLGEVTEMSDVDGDSLADLLVTDPSLDGGRYSYYANLDGTRFGPREVLSSSPSVWLTSPGVQLADMDGDGAADVLARLSSSADGLRYFPSAGSGTAGFGDPVVITPNTSFGFEDPDVKLVDLDHDRRTDWLRIDPTTGLLFAGFNLGGGGFTDGVSLGRLDPAEVLSFSAGLRIADLNGDGLSDLVSVRSGRVRFWPGMGRGRFDQVVILPGAPTLSDTELSALKVQDVTGDGLADLVHVGVSQVRIWRNQAGTHLADAASILGTPQRRPETVVRVADMNGNGSGDIVWVTSTASAPWQYLDLLGDGAPGLITRVENGLGMVTTLGYAGLGEMRAWARESAVPWTQRCAVGQMVVAEIAVEDGLGGRTATELRYADAYFDGATREFRGFARAVQIELGDAEQPPLVTDREFDVGEADEARKGLLLASTRRSDAGGVFDETQTSYTVREVGRAADETALLYAFADQEETRIFEGQAEPRLVRTEWQRDDHGNLIRETGHGEVSASGEVALWDDERIVERTFAVPRTGSWVLDRVAIERVLDTGGRVLAESRTTYDGEAFIGLPVGEVERGAATRVETWIEGDRFAVKEALARDPYGNVIARRDGRGGLTTMTYGEDHTFLTEVRVQATSERTLAWTAQFDRGLGVLTRLTDPDGEVSRFVHDGLGRPTAFIEPGDSDELPTRTFEYAPGAPLSWVRSEQRERSGEPGGIVQYGHVDGLGRSRGTFDEAPDGLWAARDLADFGARGWPRFVQHASFERSADPAPADHAKGGIWTTYDALGRKREEREADGSRRRWDYLPLAVREHDENDLDPASPHADTPRTEEKDGLDRIRRVIELDAGRDVVTRYDFDPLGNLVALTDPRGVVRRYEFDGRSRQTAVIDPNAGRWTYTHDDADALVARQDPTGNRVTWTRDLLGRPVEELQQAAGGAAPVTVRYHHDEPSAAHPSLGHVAGRLAWVEDEAGAVYFGYDRRGRLSDQVRRWPDGTVHHSWTEHDPAGRVVRRGFPDGSYLPHAYDERGLLRSAGGLLTDATWTADGRLDCARFGNRAQDCRSYDERLRLSRMNATGPAGQILRDLTFTHDRASHLRAVVDGRSRAEPLFDLSAEYELDDRERLVRATDHVAVTTWQHDDVGNIERITSEHDEPALNTEHRYGEDGAGPDQLTSVGAESLRYDESGRLIEDGERTLEWDGKGRLRRVTRGDTTQEYVYDFEDRRAIKTTRSGGADPEVVRYIDDDVEERDGQLVRFFFFDGVRAVKLLADAEADAPAEAGCRVRGPASAGVGPGAAGAALLLLVGLAVRLTGRGRRSWGRASGWMRRATLLGLLPLALLSATCASSSSLVHDGTPIDVWPASASLDLTDRQHSVVASVDAVGAVVAERAYHPYGMLRGTSGTGSPHLFVGNERDQAVGLDDFRARAYRSSIARFLSFDPAALQPESVAQASQPAYAYAAGNPIDYWDPDGRDVAAINAMARLPAPCSACTSFEGLRWEAENQRPQPPTPMPEFLSLDQIQVGLDAASLVDQTPVTNLLSAGVSMVRGDLRGAGLSLGAAVLTATLVGDEVVEGYKIGRAVRGSTRATSKIDRAAFKTEREAFWKAEAKNNPGTHSADDLARMKKGRAPTGPDGHPMELHHVDRTPEGGLQPMTRTEHRLGENYKKNHPE